MERDMSRMVMRILLVCLAIVMIVGGIGNVVLVRTVRSAMRPSWEANVGVGWDEELTWDEYLADKRGASDSPELWISSVVAFIGVLYVCYHVSTMGSRTLYAPYCPPDPPRHPPRRRSDIDVATGCSLSYRYPPKGKVG